MRSGLVLTCVLLAAASLLQPHPETVEPEDQGMRLEPMTLRLLP